ncbi:MAG: nucleotide sugar dehydrogenase [Sphingobacteriales bacterium]|nr:MAG: nucleotide sugar dehydrogenase [Sphingobacteriales bacterium]TAF81090.1 MAG: nucleotide sugar dehydrogenase [Sphingobacteriales bacterium]
MKKPVIAIIGLGYVGLPLAVAFAKYYNVIGFDTNPSRVTQLQNGNDTTFEITSEELLEVQKNNKNNIGLTCTPNPKELKKSNIFIITVPTPVDKNNGPDLTALIGASQTVAQYLKPNDIVIYESTVYPGATEEVCVPVLQTQSGLTHNQQFFTGYSPERINPGDKVRTLTNILKITSGSNADTAEKIDQLYKTIITAGTFKVSSIKVAEATKVIENCQRDVNIAFVNELSKIFNRLGIETYEVLEAAATKWNFLNFTPGLVGGHCIGVDPYYLAQKAQEVGYHPEIILAARRLNDGMGTYIATETIKTMVKKGINCNKGKVLIMGFTFKENCPDVRNTRVIDMVNELKKYHLNLSIYDPLANTHEVKSEYGIDLINQIPTQYFDAIIIAVGHTQFKTMDIVAFKKNKNAVIVDVKSILDKHLSDFRL